LTLGWHCVAQPQHSFPVASLSVVIWTAAAAFLHPKSSDPGFFEIRNFSDISAANMAMQLWFQREAEAGY
jgi:hypothetical protein